MIAELWGRPSLNALFGTEFISLCVSHKPHTALEERQVGSVQREQMGPGLRESGLAMGWSRERARSLEFPQLTARWARCQGTGGRGAY